VNTSDTQNLLQTILGSPDLFPLQISNGLDVVQFAKLSEADYRNASFLDERMMRPEIIRGNVPWQMLLPVLPHLNVQCDFIFHVSHCGSTLISRLLGLLPECFALREPALLRRYDELSSHGLLQPMLGLWSRVYLNEQRALIKATSFVSNWAIPLMEWNDRSRALLITIPAESFLAAVLDGSMSDIQSQSLNRWNRLQARGFKLQTTVEKMSPGEQSAMSWLTEMVCLEEASCRFPGRTKWIDFESFLVDPKNAFHQMALFLGYGPPQFAVADHPLLNRYAKRPEVVYDLKVRSKLLDESRTNHLEEIQKGMCWLEAHMPDSIATRLSSGR
jgi:hypothetical protein